jgi:hypothetical protein
MYIGTKTPCAFQLFLKDSLDHIEFSSSKLQYMHIALSLRPMGTVASNKVHYSSVNYLTISVPSHFHRSFVELGPAINCHDPVTSKICLFQLVLTIKNLNCHKSSNSPASFVCWSFFEMESSEYLKFFYSCRFCGFPLGLSSYPLQDHILSAVHRMVRRDKVESWSIQQ